MKNLCIALLMCASLFGNDIHTISKIEGVLSKDDLVTFQELFGIESFIETGTYAGDTTAVASEVFQEVYSVEIYKPLYDKAMVRFRYYPNVHLYFGDTCNMLKEIIRDSNPKRLYWLDAHSSGGGTGGIPGFSPILAELAQIYESGDIDSVILIDDLRGMCHCDHRTNLPLREICYYIKEINPNLQFYSIGDIGIIFYDEIYPLLSISELVRAATISRFFDSDCDEFERLNQLIDAETIIASASGKESLHFSKLIGFVNKQNLGGEVIYLLWHGLRELEKKDYHSAASDFQHVANSFYHHWRVDAYLVKALALSGQVERARVVFDEKLGEIQIQQPIILAKILKDVAPLLQGNL